ncbi:MAG: glycosyltransferase, partial [Fibrobacteres bacterium]|nr:glycosyltransferase [Fibrobacterota bacterium]
MTRTPRYSIVVVTYNSSADIARCIESVKANTSDFELIAVDNASKDSTVQILKSISGIKTIFNNDNRGFTAATNQGIRATTGRYVIFLNPDTEVFPLWADRMADKIENVKGVGGVGPMSTNCLSFQSVYSQLPDMYGLDAKEMAARVLEYGGQFRDVPLLIGFCFLTSRDILMHVGLLDERLFLGNDDLEFSWRLRLHGYRLLVARDAFIAHEMQKSFNTVPKETTKRLVQESTDELYRKLVRRYGREHLPDSTNLWSIGWFTPTEQVKLEKINGPEVLMKILVIEGNASSVSQKELLQELNKFADLTVTETLADSGKYDLLIWIDNGRGKVDFDLARVKIPAVAIISGQPTDIPGYSAILTQFDFSIIGDYSLYSFVRETGVENCEYVRLYGCRGAAVQSDHEKEFDIAAIFTSDVSLEGVDAEVLRSIAQLSDKWRVYIGVANSAAELRDVMAKSKIVVDASKGFAGGLPETAAEAMASGALFMVRHGVDSCPMSQFESGSQYIEYADTNDLVSRIEYMLQHEPDRRTICETAKSAAISRYSYQAIAFKLCAVLREAVSLASSGSCSRNSGLDSSFLSNGYKNKLDLYIDALDYKKKGDFQTSKRKFEESISINSDINGDAGSVIDSASNFHIADIYFKEGALADCGKYLSSIGDAYTGPEVLLLSAKYAHARGDSKSAILFLEAAERKAPLSADFGRETESLFVKMNRPGEVHSARIRTIDDLLIAGRIALISDIELMNYLKDYPEISMDDFHERKFKRYSSRIVSSPFEEIDLNCTPDPEKRLISLRKQGRSVSLRFRNAQSLIFIDKLANGQHNDYIPLTGNVLAEYTPSSAENMLNRCGFESVEVSSTPVDENRLATKAMESVRAGRILLRRVDYTNEEWERFFMDTCEIKARPRVFKDVSKLKVSIVILTFNQREYTEKCLESIRANTPQGSYEIIIVDNASKDGTAEWLKSEKAAGKIHQLILNSDNRGVSGGWNQGMRVATGDYVLIFNNDTIVPVNWLNNMLRCAESRPDIGMVGPMSNSISGLQCEKVCGYTSMHEFREFSEKYMAEQSGNWWELFRIVGFCMLIKRKVVAEVGEFDERFGKGNFEDDDYCIRVRRAGYKIMVAGDSFIHHFGGVSFGQAGIDWQEQMRKNQILFREKWDKLDADLIASRTGSDIESRLSEAEKHIESCDYPPAVHLLLMVLEKEPRNARAYNYLGVVAWQKGNVNDGERFFKEAVTLKPDYEDAVLNLSDAYKMRGAIDENKILLENALKLIPSSKEIAQRLSDKTAIKESGSEDTGVSILISEAETLMNSGNHKEAEERYSMVLSREPDNGAALNGIGLCAWYNGNHENAYWFFRKASEIMPADEDTIINFTDAALVTGRTEEAEKVLTRALSINPRLKEVNRMLLDIKGNDNTSVSPFEQIIAARELNIQGERLISEGLVDKAEEKFREILNHIPDHFVALNNMALCDWYRGDIEGAFKGFIKALSKSPAYEDALINMFDAALKLSQV